MLKSESPALDHSFSGGAFFAFLVFGFVVVAVVVFSSIFLDKPKLFKQVSLFDYSGTQTHSWCPWAHYTITMLIMSGP